MMRLFPSRPSGLRCRGQAMIEMLIAATLVLVPLFLAIPMIAKYLDLRSHTVQAARYAAWERSVWFGGAAACEMGMGSSGVTIVSRDCPPSGTSTGVFANKWNANEKTDTQIRKEIGARLLSNNTDCTAAGASAGCTAFASSSDKSSSTFNGGDKPLWRDRRGQTLLADYNNDIGAGISNTRSPGLATSVFGPVANAASVISNFTVDTYAQYKSVITLKVREFAVNTAANGMAGCAGCPVDFLAYGTTKFDFSETNMMVSNGWSADGPGSHAAFSSDSTKITAYNQVRGLTPTSVLDPGPGIFHDILYGLKLVALVFFPELSTLELGKIDIDQVPPDRLR